MNLGLFTAIVALILTGLSSLIGLWVDRDPQRPPRWAVALSGMVVLSTLLGLVQLWDKHLSVRRSEEMLARILDDLDQLAGRDPAVDRYVDQAIQSQVQTNPNFVVDFGERTVARGEAVEAVLQRRGLSAADLRAFGLGELAPPSRDPNAEAGPR
jgi:hypothetical protein